MVSLVQSLPTPPHHYGDHLLPQKCVMMSFFIVKGGGVYVTAKNLKQAESPTYTKNRKIPLQFHNVRL